MLSNYDTNSLLFILGNNGYFRNDDDGDRDDANIDCGDDDEALVDEDDDDDHYEYDDNVIWNEVGDDVDDDDVA